MKTCVKYIVTSSGSMACYFFGAGLSTLSYVVMSFKNLFVGRRLASHSESGHLLRKTGLFVERHLQVTRPGGQQVKARENCS